MLEILILIAVAIYFYYLTTKSNSKNVFYVYGRLFFGHIFEIFGITQASNAHHII